MIVSHQHRFIFLKTSKTAGTSVEIALSRFCGRSDIVTPILAEDETMRAPGCGPRNFKAPLLGATRHEWLQLLATGRRAARFYNHMPAGELRGLLGENIWRSYFKFCIERNPWDRMVSYYHWCHPNTPRPSLSAFISSRKPYVLRKRGSGVYAIDGRIAVDKVCRYETLNEELQEVLTHLGLPGPLALPRAKAGFRVERQHYRDLMEVADRERIAQVFRREIEWFGYQY